MPGNRPKLMHLACAFIQGSEIHPMSREANMHLPPKVGATLQSSASLGYGLRIWLEQSYNRIQKTKPSRAAHYKRQAKKRANIRARSKK